MAEQQVNGHHTASQRYLSTRGADTGLSFEQVVLKGLATDGGLYIPEEIPTISPSTWQSWSTLSFPDLAHKILSLYISEAEIPTPDLKSIINRSYQTFRHAETTPLVHLEGRDLYLLELFHGPTFAFKDVALQFLGNLFEYFLGRKNAATSEDGKRYHLTVVGATSGDTGSAAIQGLRGKKDVSVFILHPKGRVSPVQEAQMTTVLDPNVHNLAVENSAFDDCQSIVKALFADEKCNETLNLGAVNSINWARILAQVVYYFHAYFSLANNKAATEGDGGFTMGEEVRFVVPTGNFGDVLAGYFAKRMGLPIEKLVIATNENDILDRFWKTGLYEKSPSAAAAQVKETLSPAMDILVSSNFERLLWFLVQEHASTCGLNDEFNATQASQQVEIWLNQLKSPRGGFGPVDPEVMALARRDFESERVSDAQTLEEIRRMYGGSKYVLDPHSAVGVAASRRSLGRAASGEGAKVGVKHISLSTAHPAKFAGAVEKALEGVEGFSFEDEVRPEEFKGLEGGVKRCKDVPNDWEVVARIVRETVENEEKA